MQLIFHQILTLDIDLMKLYKKCTAKPCSFLVTDPTLALDNSLRFRRSLLERIINCKMQSFRKNIKTSNGYGE